MAKTRPGKRTLQVTAGQKFGRLKVINPEVNISTPKRPRCRAALCLCDPSLGGCGRQKAVRLPHLLSGAVLSCGCLRADNHSVHGMYAHPLYMTWALMMDRCHNPRSKDYPGWGRRGIEVCPEWHDVTAFITWIEANIGPRPGGRTTGGRPEYTLDRINNDGNYEPGKVRWATQLQQRTNTRPSRLAVEHAEREKEARRLYATGKSATEVAAIMDISPAAASRYLRPDITAKREGRIQAAQDLRAVGRTQQWIATALGVGQTTVSRYLRTTLS
jgi:predicted transcriptional regulator